MSEASEKPTCGSVGPGRRQRRAPDSEPHIRYGEWSACSELKWIGDVLWQKFRRRVKRDWGGGAWSRSVEYEWFIVPTQKE